MSEAKLIRTQQFHSQIFEEAAPGNLRRAKKTNTFTSSIFAHVVPERETKRAAPVQTNYARQKYQLSSTVLAGSIEQASTATEKEGGRLSPSHMKIAGKKVNPSSDFTYKPRISLTLKSEVFRSEDSTPSEAERPSLQNHLRSAVLKTQKKSILENESSKASSQLGDAHFDASRRLSSKILRESVTSSSEWTPQSHTAVCTPAHQPDSLVFDFTVKGLRANQTSSDLRKLCGNFHIVSAKADENPLTGACRGTGKVQIRVAAGREADVRRMQRTLARNGLLASQGEHRSSSIR